MIENKLQLNKRNKAITTYNNTNKEICLTDILLNDSLKLKYNESNCIKTKTKKIKIASDEIAQYLF